MEAIALSALLVFAAEFGDKSQLIAMTLTARYKTWVIIAGLTLSTAAMNVVSAFAGRILQEFINPEILSTLAGIAFLVFAALSLWDRDDQAKAATPQGHGAAIIVISLTFAAAELGDKTMLAVMTLATQHPWQWVWIGSTIGMVASAGIAVFAGSAIMKRVSSHRIRYISAAAFALVGLVILFG